MSGVNFGVKKNRSPQSVCVSLPNEEAWALRVLLLASFDGLKLSDTAPALLPALLDLAAPVATDPSLAPLLLHDPATAPELPALLAAVADPDDMCVGRWSGGF